MSALERRYLPGGAVAHLLAGASAARAVCGIAPYLAGAWAWLGTGSQVEYETVASLPDCKLCLRRRR